MAGLVKSAGLIGAELVLGLDSGEIINAGLVQGPRGLRGDPGPPGPKGDDGEDGNTLLHGARRPAPTDGKPGDFWLDVSATDLWGPKEASNRWPGPVHLLSEAARRDRIGGPMQRRGGGRSGPAFFGGVGTGTANQALPQQGLTPIIGNGQPMPAARGIKIADSSTGTLFDVKIRAESATGVWAGTVNVANFNAIADHDVYGELSIGANPPVLAFTPVVNGNKLELSVRSDQPLVKIEGVVIEVG